MMPRFRARLVRVEIAKVVLMAELDSATTRLERDEGGNGGAERDRGTRYEAGICECVWYSWPVIRSTKIFRSFNGRSPASNSPVPARAKRAIAVTAYANSASFMIQSVLRVPHFNRPTPRLQSRNGPTNLNIGSYDCRLTRSITMAPFSRVNPG